VKPLEDKGICGFWAVAREAEAEEGTGFLLTGSILGVVAPVFGRPGEEGFGVMTGVGGGGRWSFLGGRPRSMVDHISRFLGRFHCPLIERWTPKAKTI